jgi:hypothetical protein
MADFSFEYLNPIDPEQQPSLITYIRDKKNRKIGTIQAFKVVPEYLKEEYDIHVEKPIVVIVHNKRNVKIDKFDWKKEYEIISSRLEYYILNFQNETKRKKYIDQQPTRDLKKYYQDMIVRCQRYFKDCDQIVSYIDMFDYTKMRPLDVSFNGLYDINDLADRFVNWKCTNYVAKMQIPESGVSSVFAPD